MTRRGRFFVTLSTLALLSASCGGSSPVAPSVCLSFNAPASAPSTVTPRTASGATCDLLSVDLLLRDVNDVFAAEFVAAFDPAVVRYESVSDLSSHLRSDGANVQTVVQEQTGRITVGISRIGAQAGVNFTGERLLLRLTFRRASTSAAVSSLVFSSTAVYGSETPPVAKPGIAWQTGTFRVQ